MALKHFVTVTTQTNGQNGNPGPVILDFDPSIAPFQVSIWLSVTGGTAPVASIDITMDDLENPDGTANQNVDWQPDPQFAQAIAPGTVTMGSYITPIRAARLNVTTTSGATFTVKTRQGDIIH